MGESHGFRPHAKGEDLIYGTWRPPGECWLLQIDNAIDESNHSKRAVSILTKLAFEDSSVGRPPFGDHNIEKKPSERCWRFWNKDTFWSLTGATPDLKSCTFSKDLSVAELIYTHVSTACLPNHPRALFPKAFQSHCLKPLFLFGGTVGPCACVKSTWDLENSEIWGLRIPETVLNLLTYTNHHLHCDVFCLSAFILLVRIHYSAFAIVHISTPYTVLSQQNLLQWQKVLYLCLPVWGPRATCGWWALEL